MQSQVNISLYTSGNMEESDGKAFVRNINNTVTKRETKRIVNRATRRMALMSVGVEVVSVKKNKGV